MDRRIRRTREAIFSAFCELLAKKHFDKISVAEIIEAADVGRATFYSHFETKDYLLKELCGELFCHIFDSAQKRTDHRHIFECDSGDEVFLHLFEHFYNDDNRIRSLLCSQNNTLFLTYFRQGLKKMLEDYGITSLCKSPELPQDYTANHIAASFVETVSWWSDRGMTEPPKVICGYFMLAVFGEPLQKTNKL